jgi:hypothetical protein
MKKELVVSAAKAKAGKIAMPRIAAQKRSV